MEYPNSEVNVCNQRNFLVAVTASIYFASLLDKATTDLFFCFAKKWDKESQVGKDSLKLTV